MDTTTNSIIWLIATLLTGLSAGLFYAWQVSVIPGTKQISTLSYIETMQSINRAIINPAFLLIFIGPLPLQLLTTYQHRGTSAMWFLLAASLSYFFGTLLVTSLGNIPLNNALDVVNIKDMSPELLLQNRSQYEIKWNRLHILRTVFAVLSFLLLLIPVLFKSNFK